MQSSTKDKNFRMRTINRITEDNLIYYLYFEIILNNYNFFYSGKKKLIIYKVYVCAFVDN